MQLCILLFQVFMGSLLLVKQGYAQAAIIWVVLPYSLQVFHRSCNARFGSSANYVPLLLAAQIPKLVHGPVSEEFVSPALRADFRGWSPEAGKSWVGWGVPR